MRACIIPSPACGTLLLISHCCQHCPPHHHKYIYKYGYKYRKNALSDFAQNCPNCPDLPRTAQKSPKLPRIAQNAQNCPKCPELPRLVFRYVLLKHSERKFFSGTPCTLRIYADDKHHSNNQRYTNVLQQISVSMI